MIGVCCAFAMRETAPRHRKGKANDKAQKRQRSCSDNIEILSLSLLAKGPHFSTKNIADISGKPLQKENGREYDKGAIDDAHDRAHPSTACQRGAEKPKEIP